MPHVIGIDIGDSTTAAAVCRWHDGVWRDAAAVQLGARSTTIPTVLTLSPAGDFLAGDAADTGATDCGRTARGFSRRVGDDVPLTVGGEPFRAQDLTAALARWVVDRIEEREGEATEQVVLAHPAGWGPYRQNLLYDALWRVGLGDTLPVAGPLAAAECPAAAGRFPVSGVLAGYALGGSCFEASLVARPDWTAYDLLGYAESRIGGEDLDDALLARVRTAVGGALGNPRSTDPAVRLAMSWLRRNCAVAREGLSVAAEAAVRVPVSDGRGEVSVSVSRAALVELIRPAVQATVDTLLGVVRSCGLEPAGLAGVLLTGGAAQTPFVTELISASLPCPVLRDHDPAMTVANGAALLAGRIAADRYAAPAEIWTGEHLVGAAPDEAVIPPPMHDLVWSGMAGPAEQPPRPPVEIKPPELTRSGGQPPSGRGTRHPVRPLRRLRGRR